MDIKELSKQAQQRIHSAGRGRIVLARPNGRAGWKLMFIPATAALILVKGNEILALLDAGWRIVAGR